MPACFTSQCADERADEKGEALLTAQAGRLQWGLWASMHRGGTRFKLTIDFGPELGLSVEVPKTVALLPNVAVRALVRCRHVGNACRQAGRCCPLQAPLTRPP